MFLHVGRRKCKKSHAFKKKKSNFTQNFWKWACKRKNKDMINIDTSKVAFSIIKHIILTMMICYHFFICILHRYTLELFSRRVEYTIFPKFWMKNVIGKFTSGMGVITHAKRCIVIEDQRCRLTSWYSDWIYLNSSSANPEHRDTISIGLNFHWLHISVLNIRRSISPIPNFRLAIQITIST